MKVYKVQSTNMDVQDGTFEHGYFMQKKHAEDALKAYSQQFEGKEEVLDLGGKLDEYSGRSLRYTRWHYKPATYHKSHWGNYRMVIWISEIHIQE